jgi:diguanylate cyclase (GGDEF)-like protein
MTNAPEQSARVAALPAPRLASRPLDATLLYAVGLFVAAVAALAAVASATGGWMPERSPWWLAFFLLYGLFTIHAGCVHPRVGHVSFDRVSQVASILVLGPVAAAWINGLASLLWPLQRLREGRPLRDVISASLHNSGLMTLMIVGCGQLYVLLSGPVPLIRLDGRTALLLLALIISMQVVNELLMLVHQRLRSHEFSWAMSGFATAMEVGSALAGVLLAITINRMDFAVIALLLVVLGICMLGLNQFARMRNRLEALVEERTGILHDKMREFEELATLDQLTGLVNRRFADETLRQCIQEFNHSEREFSIALIDLDHFKSINDRYSHETGDDVLRKVARILAAGCRDSDVLARFGGEEFLVCFPGTGIAAAAETCERLRRAVEAANWSALAPDIRVSLSAGVADMKPGLTRSMLLKAADARLYQAKHAGRNQVIAA